MKHCHLIAILLALLLGVESRAAITTGPVSASSAASGFVSANGITDQSVVSDLNGMLNEVRSSVISNNVVLLHSFLPRFNPSGNTNGVTTIIGGYPIAFSNSIGGMVNRFGLVLSNSQVLVYNLPDCRTNTQIYVWHLDLGADGNAPMAFHGALANPAADEMLALGVGGNTSDSYRIRSAGLENALSGNSQKDWMLQFELGTWAWPRTSARYAAGNFVFTGLCYDGNSLSCYEDFCQQKIDFNNPTLSTNYTAVGISLNAPLTNLIIGGGGYTNIATMKNSESVCAGVMILNTPVTNILQWKAAYRILMWMFPDKNYYYTVGDSTMGFSGNFEPNTATSTNSPWVAFKSSQALSNALLTQCYAISADAIEHYFTWGQDGNLSTNNLFKFDAGFLPAGKFGQRTCFFKMLVNDIFGSATYTNQTLGAVQSLAGICASNNILFDVMTVPLSFSNSSYGSVVLPGREAFRQWINANLITNAWQYNRVIRDDLLVSPHTMDTNTTGPGYSSTTDGGIHMGGPLGFLKNNQLANLMLGISQPVQSDPTILSPAASPFFWTNVYSAAVTFTWSGGTVAAVTNTVTLTSASGETSVPSGNVVSVVYTGAPILNWYFTPGYITP